MRRAPRPGAALVVLAALLLAGCQSIFDGTAPSSVAPTPPPEKTITFSPVPEDPEHSRIVAAYGGVYDNPAAARAVARTVGRLVAASDDPSVSYRITILNSPVVNAFALPSGSLYVTRGLLALANDSSEVAAVVAHEMAHVTARHAIARQRRNEAAQTVNRVVASVVQDAQSQKQALTTTALSLARFSQVQELEADAIGVKTLARAGYDPFAAARFLTSMGRFAEWRAARGVAKPDFLSSHPSTPERITFAVRQAREIGAPGIGEQDREAYLGNLDGLTFGDDPAEGFVRGRTYLHRDLGIAFTVPEGWTIENTAKAVLATSQDGTALRFDGVQVATDTRLGDYLASGWVNGLAAESINESTLGGAPFATASAAADGWAFRIAVVRAGPTVYRFIFASRQPSEAFERAVADTVRTFRSVTAEEKARLRPLRLKTVKARAGDTVESLAGAMTGVDRPVDLFKALNGLQPGDTVQAGQTVKLVTEG